MGGAGSVQWLAGAKVEREWIVADRVARGEERAGWSGAAYGSADLEIGRRLRLSAGTRLTASEAWGTDLAPRVATQLRAGWGGYLKLAGARGFRAPSFKELYTEFLNSRAFYAVRGSTELKPEYSWNATGELGLRRPGVRAYARGFANRLRDFIETTRTGDSAGVAIFEYRNVGRARTDGVEIGLTVGRGLVEAAGSYASLDTRDEATDTELAGRARHRARGTVTVSPGRLSVRAEVARSGRVLVQRASSGPVYQEAYTQFHGSGIGDLGVGLRATLGVENLLDDVPDGALVALGRRWYAGLSWGGGW